MSGPFGLSANGNSFFAPSVLIGENVGQETRQVGVWLVTFPSLVELPITKPFETHTLARAVELRVPWWAPDSSLLVGV